MDTTDILLNTVSASDGQINNISQLVEDLLAKQAELEVANQVVKDISEAIREIEDKKLPEAMAAAQCKKHTTSSGYTVEVGEHVHASIPEPNRDSAHDWLRKHDAADLIKVLVAAQFGKGQEKLAAELVALIKEKFAEHKVVPSAKEGVQWNTLTAWVKEQLADEERKDLFTDQVKSLLGIFVGRKAKVKPPKK